jgi:hypothetical protein
MRSQGRITVAIPWSLLQRRIDAHKNAAIFGSRYAQDPTELYLYIIYIMARKRGIRARAGL